jgi:hypothetical protein
VEPRRQLEFLKRRRRRLSSACFFVAGIGFGTAIYILRARFATLGQPRQLASFLALVGLMAAAFYLGARAEAEVGSLEEQIRDLDEEFNSTHRKR